MDSRFNRYGPYGDPSDRTRLRTFDFAAVSYASCSRFDEHGADLMVIFNPDPAKWSLGDHPDESGDRLYTERDRSDALFGSTATFGHFGEANTLGLFVLFTIEGISPTIPVTREEYLRALIFALEGKNQERLKEALAHASKTQYQRWLEDAPARKKRNDEILAVLSRADPAEAAKVRADLEKVERDGEASVRKSEPQERAELDRNIAAIKAPGDGLRAQIAAMTPAERASPAYSHGFPGELLSRGAPNARSIVRINPAFYRTGTSVAEVRAILVRLPGVYKEARPQHEQLFRQFDWAAVKQMVSR